MAADKSYKVVLSTLTVDNVAYSYGDIVTVGKKSTVDGLVKLKFLVPVVDVVAVSGEVQDIIVSENEDSE